jgi:hypothetical protein
LRTEIFHIIHQLLIKAFYRQHAIILGMVYLVLFGAVEGNHLPAYHLKLIEGTLSDWGALVIVMAIWLLYFMRVLFFLTQVIENKQNGLLQQISLLKPLWCNGILFYTIWTCLLPVSTYALAIIIWGFGHGESAKAWYIVILFFLMHTGALFYLRKKLINRENRYRGRTWFFQRMAIAKKFPFQIYLQYVWNEQKVQWLVVKLMMAIAIGICFSKELPGGELRFSIFFFAMLFLIHTNLIRQFIIWENTAFWHMRLLPVSVSKKWLNYLLFFGVILLPEIFLLIRLYPVHLYAIQMLGLVTLCMGLLLFVFSVCIATNNITADYGPLLILILLLTYIAALAGWILPFSVLLLLVSYIIYTKSAAQFELQNRMEANS